MKSLLGRVGLAGAIILFLASAAHATVCSDIKAKCFATCAKLSHPNPCFGGCTNKYRACVKSGANSNSGGGQAICKTGNKQADAKCMQQHNVTKGQKMTAP